MPPRNTIPFTKANINAKTTAIIESFIVESSCELPPPSEKMKINGLYVLLSKIDIVMDRKILEKLEKTMALLMKMETELALGNMLVSTFI